MTRTVYCARTLFEMTRTVFENAIEADGLTKRYGEVQALDGVDLHVEVVDVFWPTLPVIVLSPEAKLRQLVTELVGSKTVPSLFVLVHT